MYMKPARGPPTVFLSKFVVESLLCNFKSTSNKLGKILHPCWNTCPEACLFCFQAPILRHLATSNPKIQTMGSQAETLAISNPELQTVGSWFRHLGLGA